ncbi:hypothetical protein K439DRAFT_1393126 [Ramaria rubella]|nr:hypothetical protein K439DRAFT_1393126 [Ramaria rubella]
MASARPERPRAVTFTRRPRSVCSHRGWSWRRFPCDTPGSASRDRTCATEPQRACLPVGGHCLVIPWRSIYSTTFIFTMASKPPKHPLSIRLAESVVFLRGAAETAHSRRRNVASSDTPAFLRGLLTLHLSKPTRISSIEITLEGKSSIQWPDANARRIDIPEDHVFLSANAVFFDAKTCLSSNRSTSVGPGTRLFDDEFPSFRNDSLPGTPRFTHSPPPHSSFDASSLHPTYNMTHPSRHQRRNSADEFRWQSDSVSHGVPATLSPEGFTPPNSPPYTPTAATSELPVISRPSTPTFSLSENSHSHRRPRSMRIEENPGQMLEEFRNVLRMEIGTRRPESLRTPSGGTIPPTPDSAIDSFGSSQSSLAATLPRSESAPGSRSASRDVEERHARQSSMSALHPALYHGRTSPSPSPSPSTPPTLFRSFHQLPTQSSPEHEHEQFPGRRASSRWSLTNMTSVLKDAKDKLRSTAKDTDVHRGRTPERRTIEEHHVEFAMTNEDIDNKRREKEHKSALSKLTAAVRLDEPSHVDNWKEFRKGTYTYPISFSIPSNSPPTVHCDFGAVIYRLKAVVHRPGALTSKLSATREVTLVASPADDDSEETHSIAVERQWDTQLRYLIALSGRSFPIGSHIPFNLTMVPMEKCKVYRLSVFLEEKTEYFIKNRQVTREQPIKRHELLAIRHTLTEKNSPPILPILPEHVSIITPYIDSTSSSTIDEALSTLMGPGPWVLNHDLQLPTDCNKLHFTYKHKGSNISVSHILKIVFRVERGDDQFLDPKTGKRRLFDIVVQTPIHILSCHCKPEWTLLPRYSLFESGPNEHLLGTSRPTCACSGDVISSLLTLPRAQVSPAGTPSNSRPTTAEPRPNGSGSTVPFGHAEGHTTPVQHLVDNSHQFARLMSGQESVLGEPPPRYQEALRA